MKFVAIGLLALSGFAGSAFAIDFTGPVAAGNWASTSTGTFVGGSPTVGSAVFSTTQLVLTGGNSISPPPGGDTPGCTGGSFQVLGPCQFQSTIGLGGTYAFNWSYLTADGAGPGGDIFGVIVDGTRTVLSNPGGAIGQNGATSFTAASSFGFFINCTDCIGGSASATVSGLNYTAQAIPEPSTYALMLLGALGVAGQIKRRKKA